jgi:hypothetical protein
MNGRSLLALPRGRALSRNLRGDKNIVAFYFYGEGLIAHAGVERDAAGAHVKFPTMPRAFEDVSGQPSLTQWRAAMQAEVVHREELTAHVAERNVPAQQHDQLHRAGRHISDFCHLEKFGHGE